MRAALAEEFGGIDSVRLGERPEPAAGAGQVLVGTAHEGLVDRGRLRAGETVLITGEPFAARVTRPRLEALNRLVDAGALRPQVSAELPLDQAREALAQVAARHARGKIVLRVGQ